MGMIFVEGDGYKASAQYSTPAVYYDAVGDLGKVGPEWGTSMTHWQIRTLRDPMSGNAADRYRDAAKLHADPIGFGNEAARVISKNWTDFHLWTSFRTEEYKKHMTKGDYLLVPGHPDAAKWSN